MVVKLQDQTHFYELFKLLTIPSPTPTVSKKADPQKTRSPERPLSTSKVFFTFTG